MSAALRTHAWMAVFGLGLGYALSRVGFTDFGQLHAMLTFADLRMLLAFCTAVGLLFVGFQLLARNKSLPRRQLHPGVLPGAVLFGVGWAVCGACPSVALVQIGEGQLGGALTLGGMLVGSWVYGRVHAKYFRWDPGSCDSV